MMFEYPPEDDYHMTGPCDIITVPKNALGKQEGGGHYKGLAIQPVEYIIANGIGYLEGNVIKYVTRHKTKNGVEDIKKAIHYLELILQLQYKEGQVG